MQSKVSNYIRTNMDSFHIYLPSNACEFIYPNNTSTDYRTRLDHTMQLEGEWEVGVESIFYSSEIDNANKGTKIDFDVKTYKKCLAGCEKFNFLLDKNEKWKGVKGILPTKYETDPAKTANVLKTLNSLNQQIVKGKTQVFHFTKDNCQLNIDNFYIEITSSLAKALGYGNQTIFHKSSPPLKKVEKITSLNLYKEDYLLKYFYPNAQRKLTRIEIKPPDVDFFGKEKDFLKLWREKTKSLPGLVVNFKDKKVGIKNHRAENTLVFSDDFASFIGRSLPIIGNGKEKRWGSQKVDFVKLKRLEKAYLANCRKDHWYVDIYSTKANFLEEKGDHHFSIDVYPWQYKTLKESTSAINSLVQKTLKEKLRKMYDKNQHRFEMKLTNDSYSKLELGHMIKIKLSPFLQFFYGINKEVLQNRESHGTRPLDNLIDEGQELFLLSNIAKPTGFGQQHLQILQSFLHKTGTTEIIERRFDPLVFLPLMTSSIDMIQLQLTDADYQPVLIPDHKTVVCLYFRKVREKTFV